MTAAIESLEWIMNDRRAFETEARCDGRMHFKVVDGRIQVKCSHLACTRGNSVVFHYFSPEGILLETLRVQDPQIKLRSNERTTKR
jgi:hypothetical protein